MKINHTFDLKANLCIKCWFKNVCKYNLSSLLVEAAWCDHFCLDQSCLSIFSFCFGRDITYNKNLNFGSLFHFSQKPVLWAYSSYKKLITDRKVLFFNVSKNYLRKLNVKVLFQKFFLTFWCMHFQLLNTKFLFKTQCVFILVFKNNLGFAQRALEMSALST